MKRPLALLLLVLLLVPAPAAACDGPLARLRARLHARLAPAAPQYAAPACPRQVYPAPATPLALPPAVEQVPMIAGDVPVVGAAGDLPLRQRILLDVLRGRAVERAVRSGVVMPDGSVRKVTRAEARALADRVTDEHLVAGAKAYGAPAGEGRLEAFFLWVWEHREELIKFILSIFAIFADEQPVSLDLVPVETAAGWRVLMVATWPGRVVLGVL